MLLLVVFMSFLAVKVVPCFLDKAWVSHIPPLELLALDSLWTSKGAPKPVAQVVLPRVNPKNQENVVLGLLLVLASS